MKLQNLFEAEQEKVHAEIARQLRENGGITLGYFFALMNITKELLPLQQRFCPEKVWVDYLAFAQMLDRIREQPALFGGWDEVVGAEHRQQILQEGGAFLTWHTGFVRHHLEAIAIGRAMLAEWELPFYQVVDREQFNHEQKWEMWERLRDIRNIQLINAEDQLIGLKLFQHLRRGGAFCLKLDGQKGVNADQHTLRTKWLTSIIETRSGVFRILARAQKKVSLVVMSMTEDFHSRIVFHPPQQLAGQIEKACDDSFAVVREELLRYPWQWRFWDRHHEQVVAWQDVSVGNENMDTKRIKWVTQQVGKEGLGLDVETGQVYQLSPK
ncbi:hypothetical protein [Mechercharimyces sp. CAU 1602]|uniref:hypothetical protein n=1 Tax=Mechercharimyces sp. CAU 1602 TaxID=2973933 RepID=UPI002162476D|nr:hypothetical protein [Mechercharimyces sp. CAU 1602]MCS1352500.1 hypothetical protein [Mechercharimyces sp. CAU 1602]